MTRRGFVRAVFLAHGSVPIVGAAAAPPTGFRADRARLSHRALAMQVADPDANAPSRSGTSISIDIPTVSVGTV